MEPRYPQTLTETDHVAPVPRRIRGFVGAEAIFDTERALYVWERPHFPQYYVPLHDVRADLLVDEDTTQHSPRGRVALHGLRVGEIHRPHSAKVLADSPIEGLSGTVRFEWKALDSWFEEDERVYVHPRSPYVRVDALRSTRALRVELDGVVLATTGSPVMVYETGLPTRYYLNATDVDYSHLLPSDTVTECPYKGTTGAYWSAKIGDEVVADVAWSYAFPTRQLQPITGMIAFYNEKVDIFLDGELLERPDTHFSPGRAGRRTGSGR
jgi:uncharacterized protein (DUF427 family)